MQAAQRDGHLQRGRRVCSLIIDPVVTNQDSETGFIDLLRHGLTETSDIFRGRVEDPLSEIGWQQMSAAVAGRSWDVLISSPLDRCARFATHCANQWAIEAIIEPRFAEYHFGDWDGRRYQDVMAGQEQLVKRFFDDPFACTPPNAEEFADFHQRVLHGWGDVLQKHAGRKVLVITHGGVIMSVLADVFGRKRIHGRIDVDYASMSRIRPGTEGVPHRLVFHGALPEVD